MNKYLKIALSSALTLPVVSTLLTNNTKVTPKEDEQKTDYQQSLFSIKESFETAINPSTPLLIEDYNTILIQSTYFSKYDGKTYVIVRMDAKRPGEVPALVYAIFTKINNQWHVVGTLQGTWDMFSIFSNPINFATQIVEDTKNGILLISSGFSVWQINIKNPSVEKNFNLTPIIDQYNGLATVPVTNNVYLIDTNLYFVSQMSGLIIRATYSSVTGQYEQDAGYSPIDIYSLTPPSIKLADFNIESTYYDPNDATKSTLFIVFSEKASSVYRIGYIDLNAKSFLLLWTSNTAFSLPTKLINLITDKNDNLIFTFPAGNGGLDGQINYIRYNVWSTTNVPVLKVDHLSIPHITPQPSLNRKQIGMYVDKFDKLYFIWANNASYPNSTLQIYCYPKSIATDSTDVKDLTANLSDKGTYSYANLYRTFGSTAFSNMDNDSSNYTKSTDFGFYIANEDKVGFLRTVIRTPGADTDSNNMGAIIGGVIGGIVGAALIGGGAFYFLKSKKAFKSKR